MYRFILKRLLMLIPVLLGVSFIVYTILSFTPGNPVAAETPPGCPIPSCCRPAPCFLPF